MDWQIAYLRAAGAPTTAANIQFLNNWQRWEGGATHNDATYNYLNTTYGKGPTMNGVGVRKYSSLAEGANAFAKTLEGNRGYSGLLRGLRAGDPYKMASRTAAGLSTWVSGSPTGNLSYAEKVLGHKVAGVTADAAGPTGTATTDVPTQGLTVPSTAIPDMVAQNLSGHLSPQQQLSSLVAAVAASPPAQAATSPLPSPTQTVTPGRPVKGWKPGIPVGGLSSIGGEHATDGLPGYPAHDYFAKAGSPTVAPVTGKVIRLSGHDPRLGAVQGAGGPLGWSVYIQGTDGHTYYLTHMGSRNVKVGQTVTAGQRIGTVANYDKYGRPSHIHMGVK